MIARIKAMLRHVECSEDEEFIYLERELAETASRMYKYPLWKPRSLRERGLMSIYDDTDREYWYEQIRNFAPDIFLNRPILYW